MNNEKLDLSEYLKEKKEELDNFSLNKNITDKEKEILYRYLDAYIKAFEKRSNFYKESIGSILLEAAQGYIKFHFGDDAYTAYDHISWEGGEDEGTYAEGVFKLEDTYFKFNCEYQSYNGFFEDEGSLQVVVPVERLVTVYETA